MADISIQLDKIRNAIYGEDVRSAIFDAIKAINDEVSKTDEAITKLKQHALLDDTFN